MRLAVISDIHGNYAALDAVLTDIARRGVDSIVNLGDVLAGPFDPVAVVQRIRSEAIPTVRGNHDRWIAQGREDDWEVDAWVRETIAPEDRAWLGDLPDTLVVADDIFMCHATPQDDVSPWMDGFHDDFGIVPMPRDSIEARAAGLDHPVLLCGHTHTPRTLRLSGDRLLVNPGSVGLPFLLGTPDARYAIVEKRGTEWGVELIAIPYDRRPAIEQAIARGYPGFATAIQTGWAKLADL